MTRSKRFQHDAVGDALRVSYVTVVWSTTTGVCSAVIALAERSLALGALGVTVLVDVGSSVVLIWRFRHERAAGSSVERAERLAHRVASGALAVFATALIGGAVSALVRHAHAATSWSGIGLAIASALVLPPLARWKYRAARRVSSRALRADAHITSLGAAMASVTVVGLLLSKQLGWWWADPTAAIVLSVAALAGSRIG